MKRRHDLHTPAWAKLRLIVLARDKWRCTACGCTLTPGTGGASVDHIVPHAMGGTNDLSNLRAMCRYCNSRRGARQARGHRLKAPMARPSRFG